MSTLKSSRYWVLRVLSILRDECFVEVYLKDGSAIRGKITAAETKQLSGFALKEAIFTIVKDSVSYTAQKCQTMIIDTADIVYISAKECEKKRLDALDEQLDRVLKEFSPSEYNSTCVPPASVASGPNLAESLSAENTTLDTNLKEQEQLQLEQPQQEQPQQQHCARMFDLTLFEGTISLLILKNQKVLPNIRELTFLAGKLLRQNKSDKDVVVREYVKDMTSFFKTMRRIQHRNILKARNIFYATCSSGSSGCVIAFESVQYTLASYVISLKDKLVKNRVGLIAKVMRQVLDALFYAHNQFVYHDDLTMESVYICTDSSNEDHLLEHIDVKLSFAKLEEHAINAKGDEDFWGTSQTDRNCAANLLMELAKSIEPFTFSEFQNMYNQIRGKSGYTLLDFNSESVFWTLDLKVSFVNFMVEHMYSDDVGMRTFNWTRDFDDWIGPIKKHCKDRGATVAEYKNLVSHFVRFMDNTFHHLPEYELELKDRIGDREKAMERFEKSYLHLFDLLTGCARRLHLMDAFFKSRDMFLG